MAFTCPRCHEAADQTYYGPCDRCRAHLRAAMRSEARDIGDVGFEPAMHVTPNAVALKDD